MLILCRTFPVPWTRACVTMGRIEAARTRVPAHMVVVHAPAAEPVSSSSSTNKPDLHNPVLASTCAHLFVREVRVRVAREWPFSDRPSTLSLRGPFANCIENSQGREDRPGSPVAGFPRRCLRGTAAGAHDAPQVCIVTVLERGFDRCSGAWSESSQTRPRTETRMIALQSTTRADSRSSKRRDIDSSSAQVQD